MLQRNIWPIANYQDDENHPKFVQTPKYCKRSLLLSSQEFPTSSLWPYFQIPWRNVWTLKMLAAFRWSTHFSLKQCRWTNWVLEVFAVATLQKICFDSEKFVIVGSLQNNTNPSVRTGGDALMKLPCSGLLPSIEVGLCYLRKWRRGESFLFYFKTITVDVDECIQPQQHWPKQHSKVVTAQERLLSIIQFFAKVFCRLNHLLMK